MTAPQAGHAPDIGIVADFLFQGGAETVIDLLAETYPAAQLYAQVHDPASIRHYPHLEKAKAQGRLTLGPADRLLATRPFRWAARHGISLYHYYWLYFLTAAFEKTAPHDAIIVSCAAQSKLVRLPASAAVVVYFHTPTRWLYKGLTTKADLAAIPAPLRLIMRAVAPLLRTLDRLGLRRLRRHNPLWLCNSSYVRDRLAEFYGIDATVLYPPVDISRFSPADRAPQDFFLYHGRITLQKRVDLAIDACLIARKRLVISGQAVSPEIGQHLTDRVARAEAADPSLRGLVTFLGRTDDATLDRLMATCAALVFPPREDFGITPIEAMAAGAPVIAYRAGGALDYLSPGVNGAFFADQSARCLADALTTFDVTRYDPAKVAASVTHLSRKAFQTSLTTMVVARIAQRHP